MTLDLTRDEIYYSRITQTPGCYLDLETGQSVPICITYIQGVPHMHGGPGAGDHIPLAYVNICPDRGTLVLKSQLEKDPGLFNFAKRFPNWGQNIM